MTEIRPLHLVRDLPGIKRLLDLGDIRLADGLDALYGAYVDDELLGCAGRAGNVIQCAAVDPDARGEGLLNALVTRLMTDIRELGYEGAFVFTKPSAAKLFAALCFYPLAAVDEAVLLYSRKDGVARWCGNLPALSGERIGAIVMNANPFTLGHQWLVRLAANDCDALYVFVVETEASRFPFADRLALVQAGTAEFDNVAVCAGGPFMISRATFPSYFLKQASDASRVHAALDATLFAAQIAPRLSIACRYVGDEPLDALTAQYNGALTDILPEFGIEVAVVERLLYHGEPVSASRVRALFDAGRLEDVRPLVPDATYQYLRRLSQP